MRQDFGQGCRMAFYQLLSMLEFHGSIPMQHAACGMGTYLLRMRVWSCIICSYTVYNMARLVRLESVPGE